MAELGLLHCWSTFPAVPRENARKTDKALVKLISKITKINYPDGILSSFEEIGRLPGPPPFRLDPGAVLWVNPTTCSAKATQEQVVGLTHNTRLQT